MKRSIVLSILLIGILFTGCGAADNAGVADDTSSETDTTDDASGETSAEEPYILTFTATTTEGGELTSDCLAGSRLTMINVWATYCNPCLSEMPDLGEIAAAYDAADFQLIGIVSDVTEESEEAEIQNAKDLIAETNADYPHLLLNESLYMNLVGAVEAVPTTFFVNQEGELLGYVMGAQSKDTWEGIIDDLLAENE